MSHTYPCKEGQLCNSFPLFSLLLSRQVVKVFVLTCLYFIVHSGDVFLEVGGDAEALRTDRAGKVSDVEVDKILMLLQAAPVVERFAAYRALPRRGPLFVWPFRTIPSLLLFGLLFDQRVLRLRGDWPQFHG